MKPRLPRAPLPRQKGGAHRVRRNQPHRKRKHKGREVNENSPISEILAEYRHES